MNVRQIGRRDVERIARIMGEHSAAAYALAEADAHDGPCRFYQTRSKSGSHIVVERLPADVSRALLDVTMTVDSVTTGGYSAPKVAE